MPVSAQSVPPSSDLSALHARIRQAMPDLDDAAVECLGGICTELSGQPAANAPPAAVDLADQHYYATRLGLAGLVNGGMEDRQYDLSTIDWLLLSIRMAAKDDASAEWIVALSDIGSGWIEARQREIRNFEQILRGALTMVAREETGEMAEPAAGEQA